MTEKMEERVEEACRFVGDQSIILNRTLSDLKESDPTRQSILLEYMYLKGMLDMSLCLLNPGVSLAGIALHITTVRLGDIRNIVSLKEKEETENG